MSDAADARADAPPVLTMSTSGPLVDDVAGFLAEHLLVGLQAELLSSCCGFRPILCLLPVTGLTKVVAKNDLNRT